MIIHEVEQGTDSWFSLRAGIPTGSEFKKLVTSTGQPSKSMKEYAAQLAADLYAGKPLDSFGGNQYTDRGSELESEARKFYAFDSDCKVDEVGFITDDLKQYGVSPDGLVGDDGLVEFKCQIAKEHVKTLLYYYDKAKCPTAYIPQVQGQLFVTGRKWCDICFYHPDLPALIIRIEPDPVVIETLKKQLMAVIAERNLILKIINKY